MSGAETRTSMCLEPQVCFFCIQSFFLLTFLSTKTDTHYTLPTVFPVTTCTATAHHHTSTDSDVTTTPRPTGTDNNDNRLSSHRVTRLTSHNRQLEHTLASICSQGVYLLPFLHLQGSRHFSFWALCLFYSFSYYSDNTPRERLLAMGIFYITNTSIYITNKIDIDDK